MIVARLRAAGRIALLSLAVVLPFEMTDSLARLGPLQLSSVELFLYLALGCWGASLVAKSVAGERAPGPWLRRLPAAHLAVLCFAAVVVVSALAAAAPRAPGFKFALRSLGGMLLFAAAADLLRAPGAAARTAVALVGGGIVAALLTIAEIRVAVAVALLRPFHFQTFDALGRARASGPFQYPNIAAMYLEAITPVAVALGLAPEAGRGGHLSEARALRVRVAATAITVFILLDGVLATASRAGLLGALASVAVLGAVGVRTPPGRPAAWAAIAVAAAIAVLAAGSALGGRFRFWHDGDGYRAVITQASGAEGRLPPVLAASSRDDPSPTAFPPLLSEQKTLPRQALWRAGLAIFHAHPLLGIGPDNFRHRYGAFLGPGPREVDERLHANSLYVETLADLGAAGVLVFGIVVVALFSAARRAVVGPPRVILAFGVAAGLASYLLHGLLDYFMEFTPTYALFWLLAGMIVAMDRSREISA